VPVGDVQSVQLKTRLDPPVLPAWEKQPKTCHLQKVKRSATVLAARLPFKLSGMTPTQHQGRPTLFTFATQSMFQLVSRRVV
jgi:hypothetical protein